MRKLLLSLAVLCTLGLNAQSILFQEDFEGTPTVVSGGVPGWSLNSTYFHNGVYSYFSQIVNAGDSSTLVTPAFSTVGLQKVVLEFSHICKIEFLDAAEVYVSGNNGATWSKLTWEHYQGQGDFSAATGDKFSSGTYFDWIPGTQATPTNSWWKDEKFNISAFAANASQVRVMFVLRDLNNTTLFDNWGWLVDDIKIWTPSPQAASINGIILPLGLPSGCGLTNETIQVRIANEGGQNINGNLTATFQREGLPPVTEVVSAFIAPDDTLVYTFNSKINLNTSVDTTYSVKAWISLLNDPDQTNDTLVASFDSKVALPDPVINDTTIPFGTSITLTAYHTDSITWSDDPLGANIIKYGSSFTTPILLDTSIFYVQAGANAGGVFMMTEVSHYKTTVGAPVGGWPSYLIADDYIEITGVPNSDLGGYTLEQWSTTAMSSTHTFAPGTLLSPNGIAVIAVGQLGSSVPVPASFYYHGNGAFTGTWGSTTAAGRILKDGSGAIVDAVGYGAYTFPAASGVTTQHWSGNTPAVSSSGNRLIGPYTNSSANWVNSGTTPQDPGTLNSGVILPTPSGCPSRVKPVKVSVSGVPLINVGITSINNPVGVVNAGIAYPVEVTLTNFASDTLKKVEIHYTVNGSSRPVYLWTGSLPYNQITQVTIGNETFANGVFNIKAWTSMPNDSVDGYTLNDTAEAQALVCFSGTFSIGGPGADFDEITDAAAALDLVGVCGPVVFEINPGIYAGPVVINSINGVSATNTITFKSVDDDSTSVEIVAGGVATVRLIGADYITLKGLTIETTLAAATSAVELSGGADYNTITNCVLIGAASSTSTSRVVSSASGLDNYNTISNNVIKGGYTGIYLYGTSTTVFEKGNVVSGNDISDYYYYGIYVYYQDSVQVLNNTIHDNALTTGYIYGIYTYYYSNGSRVSGNRISVTPGTYGYGIRCSYANYNTIYTPSLAPVLVDNNFITVLSGTYNYGIYAYYSNDVTYAYNSVNILAGTTNGYGIYQSNTTNNSIGQKFYNNNLVNKGDGYAIYFATVAQVAASDHNNLFTTGANLAYWSAARTTLAALQAASGKDMNSKNVDPGYFSNTDLHMNSLILNGAGTPVAGVLYDIDGDLRHATTPDIGADEIDLVALDAGIVAMTGPVAPCPGSQETIEVTLKNFGVNQLTTCMVHWSVNGIAQAPYSWSGSLLNNQTTPITLGTYTFTASTVYELMFWTSAPNAGTDMNNNNDTLSIQQFRSALPAGTYTIGADATDNWPTFGDAVAALSNGVCGAVTINVKAGTYNEQVVIPEIPGTSLSNSITFQSITGDSTSVVLISNGTTLRLNGADYITIRKMTISTTATATSYAVEFLNGSSHNTLTNCVVTAAPTTTSTSRVIQSSTGNDDYNTISFNRITGGYYGLYLYGTSSSVLEKGTVVHGNDISGFYYYGLYAYYQDSIQITGNTVRNNAPTAGYIYGIATGYCFNGYNISSNKITISPGTYGYALRDYYNNYYSTYTSSMAPGLISNNFISVLSGTYSYGLYSYYSNNVSILYNSVNIMAGTTNGYALYQYNTASNTLGQTFKNNSFVNQGGGYSAYFSTIAQVIASDYNNFYSSGSTLAYWSAARTTLAALQAASGKDLNSINADPQYISASNLHVILSPLNGAATPVASVLYDIDGDLRHATTPDIGADEFDPPTQDVTVLSIVSPVGAACGMTTSYIETEIKNTGLDPIQGNLTLFYSLDGGITSVSEIVGTNILPGDTLLHTFAVPGDFIVTQDSVFNLWVWADLTGDYLTFNDSVKVQIHSNIIPGSPSMANTSTNYGTSALLTATSVHPIRWYASNSSNTIIGTGSSYSTPLLFADKWYYAEAVSTSGCGSLRDSALVTILNIPAGDLGIGAIIVNSGCGLTTTEPITIDIYNQGTGTVSSGVTATFRINNGPWVTAEPVSTPIPSGATIQYTFTSTANLFAATNTIFNISAAVSLSADPYKGNDTLILTALPSLYTPPMPVIASPVNIPYGSSTTLTAVSPDSIVWYANPTDPQPLTGGVLHTPMLFDTTTYYAQSILVHPGTSASLGLAPAGGNICNPSGAGNMFNVQSIDKSLLITGFNLRFNVLGTKGVRIYYREGTYVGYETDSTKWIYHDEATVVTTAAGQLASFTINPLAIPAGKTYGIYAMYDANYASGANTFADSEMQVTTGVGLCSNFGGINVPRTVSGEIYYSIAELGCKSPMVPVVVQTGIPPSIDAGMYAIDNPVGTVTSGLAIPVTVRVKNFGTDTINSLDITYELDGTIQNTYAWTGVLLPGQISAPVSITNTTFSGGAHTVKFWVSNANGTTQGINGNDTIASVINACLSGTYTLGTITSDYPTFASAIAALNSSGVCGDVTFKVESGIYQQQITFSPTTGAGPSSRITFESITGDSTDVIIEYTAPGATSNWTVRFDGADYYTLRGMTIKAMDPTYGTAIEMINGASYNIIENNAIQSTGIVATTRGIYDYNTLNHFNTYRNNKISGGYYGIYVYGSSTTSLEKGTVISGNDISGFYYYGIYSYYQDSILIEKNKIHSNATTTGYIYGIYTYYSFNGYEISGNDVSIAPGTYGYGIRCYYNNYYTAYTSTMAPGSVHNNFISVTSGTYAYGLYAYYSNNTSYNYNSVQISGGSTNGYGLYQYNTASNTLGQSFRNNIFSNVAGGYAAYFGTPANITVCDYNNYYATGVNLSYWGGAITDLAALKAASGKNANSLSVNPMFISATNLHASNILLNGAAIPVPGITTDIDGDLRNSNTPDIGADEFDPVPHDAGAIAVVYPVSPVPAGVQPVHVNIRNFGNDTLVSATINWSVNNVLQTPINWNGSLPTSGIADSLLIGTYAFTSGASTIKVWTSLPNGFPDMGVHNDTVVKVVVGCSSAMKGLYTIGGAGADYPSFTAAVMSLNYCGVDSAVVFSVASGIYSEQVVLGSIPGASAVNHVTFQSATGDSTDVVLTWGVPVSPNIATLTLSGTAYVTFKGITINSTTAGATYTLYLTNEAHHNAFTGCVITGPQLSTSTTRNIVISGGGLNQYNSLINNVIKGGYYGVYIYGTSATVLAKGNFMQGNQISDFYYYGVYAYYQDSMIFRNNYVTENSNGSAYYPATFGYCDNYLEVSGNTLNLKPATYTYGLRIYYCDAIATQQGRVFNNNISITTGTGTSYGLYIYYSNYQNVGFNNVNLAAGGPSSRAAYVYYGGNVRLANNNLVTTIPAYVIYYGGTGLVYSDHNNMYTTSTKFGYLSSDLATFAAWQAASGKDINSISVDPGYYAPTDLHVLNVALNNAGTPFDNVTIDIDGETRSVTTPDIGSDEFSPVPLDLDVMAFVQPALANAPVGETRLVEASVRNLGTDTITSFVLNYTYASGTPVSQSWAGTLLPGAHVNVLFSTGFTAQVGQQTLKVYLDALGTLLGNDTISMTFTGVPVVQVPYVTDFDQAPYYWYAEGKSSLWQHGVPSGSKINTAQSAPNVWATNLSGNYGGSASGEYLYSPFFNFSGVSGATMKFWHWREIGTSVDGCNVQYSINDGQTWSNLGFLADPLGTNWYTTQYSGVHAWNATSNGWVESTYDLSVFNNASAPVQFRFNFFSDASGYDEGFALDNFSIVLPSVANDVGVIAINHPVSDTASGSQINATVTIQNFGLNTQTLFPVTLKINGTVVATETWTGNLASQGTTTYTFVVPFTVPGAAYQLCAATQLPGDAYPNNDEYCAGLGVLPAHNDVGISQILQPSVNANGEICYFEPVTHSWYQYDVIVRIENFGQNTQTSIPISYTFRNGGPVYNDTWNGNLVPGGWVDFPLSNLFKPNLGAQQLCVETALTTDVMSGNNKSCKTYNGVTCIGIDDQPVSQFSLEQNIPNPASSITAITWNLPAQGEITFGLVSMVGQVLHSEVRSAEAGFNQLDLDVSGLAAGVYYYFVEYNGQRITKKLIVRR